MKKIILTFLLSALFFWGCSNKDKDNPISPSQGNGKIQLKIDSANAPTDVISVEAILSRNGYDDITGTLNLLSDSTADLLLDDIPAGVWNLLVNAKDSAGVILYTGETDVEVLAGFITQVNLVLIPTGEGTGSIYIYVTWGTTTTNEWIDFNNNPILSPLHNYYDNYGIYQPVVLVNNNLYKMWYVGDAGSAVKYVLYAESNDGINWDRPLNQPVLSPGQIGTWDSWAVYPGAIMKDGDIYRMYYTGFADQYEQWGIGFATSTDGISWEKYPQPVLYGTYGWEYQIVANVIIKHDGTYYLFYTGRNLPEYKIGLAISTDGVNFTRYSNNPILSNTESWEESGVGYPSIIIADGQFRMIYMNSSGTGFGVAYSSDGMDWTKDPSNPFFTNQNTANGWAANKIAFPNLIKIENESRIYYSGIGSSGEFFKIGFVRRVGE